MEFKGVNQEMTNIYIIDYSVYPEDINYPLSGQRGNFVTNLLGSMMCLDKVRVGNWVGQTPEVVLNDIYNSNAKCVVGIGEELLNHFVETNRDIIDVTGSVYNIRIKDKEYYYIPVVDPQYVLMNIADTDLTMKFSQALYKASQIASGEYHDILKEKNIMSAHSYDEFINIYNQYFINDPIVAYDIETNARPIFMEGSEIIGFSIGNDTSGVYVSLKSLDHEIPEDDITKIWDFTKSEIFDKKDKLIIHNTMYERPWTLYCQNYEIGYEKAEDTLVMARLLKSPKESASLKFQAQNYLNYPDWETDLGIYIENFKEFCSRIIFGPKKFNDLWKAILDNKISIFDLSSIDEYNKLKTNDKAEVDSFINKIKSVMVDLYTESEIYDIGYLLRDKFIEVYNNNGIKDSTIPYNWIPDRVLSKYGAIDSISTFDLYKYYLDVMDKESTDDVDLHKGYELWLQHMYVAYIMERNGMFWDEDVVLKDEKFLNDQATNCIRILLKSPKFEPLIEKCCGDKYKPIILSDYLPDIAISQGYEVKYDKLTDKYTIFFNGKRVAKNRIDEITISNKYQKEYYSLISEMFHEDIDNMTSWEEMKEIYNPASSNFSWVPREILMTPRVQMGTRINKLHTLSISPEFEEAKEHLNPIETKFLQLADLLNNPNELKATYDKEWAKIRKQLYEGFCNLYDNYKNKVVVPEIKSILNEKVPLTVDSFDDEGIIAIYEAQLVGGVDQDDPSTYDPEFEWMINFRLFKKSQKLLSSYINGSVGRESVVIVNKDDLSTGNKRTTRKRRYFDTNGSISEDEGFLVASKWSPNTAETGRWRSAIHTIPWNSPIKRYYSSRFKGGTIIAPDYSTMEVRSLAAISKDENMLELFREGKDFHYETASKIYQKPVSEVTQAERRFSKTATFSLLYGSTLNSFANSYCKGDISQAEKIYGGFLKAYPKVQEWIEAKHKEVQKDHRVSLDLSNRFIYIEPKGGDKASIAALLRRSQNYPIQGTSADLTGGVVYDLQKFIEDHNMKSLIFMYVHDSIEADVYPYEMIELIYNLKILLNEAPLRRMGLPSKADVTLGKSLGHEIELKEIEHNEDFTDCIMTVKGYQDEIYETVETWKEAYKTVEVYDEEWEEDYMSWSQLFILRKAYNPNFGKTRFKGKCKVHINYYL